MKNLFLSTVIVASITCSGVAGGAVAADYIESADVTDVKTIEVAPYENAVDISAMSNYVCVKSMIEEELQRQTVTLQVFVELWEKLKETELNN